MDIDYITDYLITVFEPYNVSKQDIVILDSSNDNKTSLHFVVNKIHFQNIGVLKFLRDGAFDDMFKGANHLDPIVYRVGCLRMPLCTKYGQDRHLRIVSNHSFMEALVTYIPESSEMLDLKEDVKTNVIVPIHVLPECDQSSLEHCFNMNSIGIKLYQASCSFETFKNFSKLSSKYNEQACIKKWESFTKIQKNSNMLITLLNKMDIEIKLADDTAMTDTFFNKSRLRDDMLMVIRGGMIIVRPMYSDFVVQYVNRFFCVLKHTKGEYFEIEYNQFNKPCKIVGRYTKQGLFDANDNKLIFMKHWLGHNDRREYSHVVFQPDLNLPIERGAFNIYFGLKIELENNITSYDYDQELVDPFINHIHKYFCKCNQQHTQYLLNWLSHIIQKPSTPTKVVIVLKSIQGIGKGLIFDILLGNGIFGQETYLQVNNIEGLIGHFNDHIKNKIFINVNEVFMTQNQATRVKSMITDLTITTEGKWLMPIT